jgi:hypothetical protein
MDPREARLPKWAQEELRSLRSQLGTSKRLNEELRGDVGETDVHVQNYSSHDQPLPKGARVQFRLGQRFDQYVSVHSEGGHLWLHGGRFLTIHPHVSNAFHVSVGE